MTLSRRASEGSVVAHHKPWPRIVVDSGQWNTVIHQLTRGQLSLLGLWGEPRFVHMALLDEGAGELAVISLECHDRGFPSVGVHHAPAIRLERALHDLFGLRAIGAGDFRPWLDHGRWGLHEPLGRRLPAESPRTYEFLPAVGEGVHQIPVGPVHAGIIEPGHFRVSVNGESIVRLEERLGYVHKGIESLMAGTTIERAATLAGCVSGDSTVAYSYAFARAVEAALECAPPARAQWLRALMAELERIASHFGDIGAICNDASFLLMHAHCGILRERVLRASERCFGHRMIRDLIVPGGVTRDLDAEGASLLKGLVAELDSQFAVLISLYDNTATLEDRTVGTGVLKPDLAKRFAAGGFVGRASGRSFDARRSLGYAPYRDLQFEIPVLQEGDVDARVWIRIREVQQSLALIRQILDGLPSGPTRSQPPLPFVEREGMAIVEGFRGDVLVWLRLASNGTVARCHLRDPSWFQWPLLESAIEGNIVADFPLCNKSFNCSYSGHDL